MTEVALHRQENPYHSQNQGQYSDSGKYRQHQLSTMQQPERSKRVTAYINGDKYFPGRKLVLNKKHFADFDGLMSVVTDKLKPPFGAVRNIYTPSQGHRVEALDKLTEGMAIVAGGYERFRKLGYQEIPVPARRATRPKPVQTLIRPVYHSKLNVPAKWHDVGRGPLTIFVYANGDANNAASKVLLTPRLQSHWDKVLAEVNEKVGLKAGIATRELYTIHGELLCQASELETGRYYVAVGIRPFKHLPYGERAAFIASTNARKPNVHLPPIKRRARTMNSTKPSDTSYSQKYERRRQMEETRVQRSQPPPGGSRQPPTRKLRPIRGPPPPSSESESVFHAKPVKVKRSGASGKITAVSSVKNDDDVFHAKRETTKAEEVADDEDTKVDLPIDQVPADTVEEEEELDVSVRHEDERRTPPPKTTYATRLEEDDSEPTQPSKTPTSASREEPIYSPRSEVDEQPESKPDAEPEIQRNGNAIQPPPSDEPEEENREDLDQTSAGGRKQAQQANVRTRTNAARNPLS